jgi:hypothetical protein
MSSSPCVDPPVPIAAYRDSCLFWGARDTILPISHGTAISALLENCELIRFENCGHFVHWEEPEELSSALRFFLDSPDASPAHPRSRPVPSSAATAVP